MAAITTAGTKLYASAALPATYDQTGYEALTYTEVGEITDVGEYGKEYNLVTHIPLATRRTQKLKGSYNQGSLSLQMAYDPADLGQAILVTALDSDDSISYKVVDQDGTADYFTGQVMSYRKNIGAIDTIRSASTTIEIDSDVTTVEPA